MESNRKQLMKHFATVLRNRALDKPVKATKNNLVVGCFNRKELIEILKKRFEGSIPKEHNLMELENEELFKLIGDEMYIISYVTEKWSREDQKPKANGHTKPITNVAKSKSDANGKGK